MPRISKLKWPLAVLVAANLIFGRLPRRSPRRGQLVIAGRAVLHCVESTGEGIPVVMLHGMPGLSLNFEDLQARLSGIRTVAIDRPGYGYSAGPPLAFDDQVEAIRIAMTDLHFEGAVMVGHSYGAALALALGDRYPGLVRALVLVAPAAGGVRVGRKSMRQARVIRGLQLPVIRQVADLLALRLIRKVATALGARSAYGTESSTRPARRVAVAFLARHDSIRALTSDRLEFNTVAKRLDQRVSAIELPVTVIHGHADTTISIKRARRLVATLPNAHLLEVSGDHILLASHAAEVATAIRQVRDRLSTMDESE